MDNYCPRSASDERTPAMPLDFAPRLDYTALAPDLFNQLNKLSMGVHNGGLGAGLLALIEIRASQINGCAFCVDMHSKQARQHGERELRLYHIPIWRESPLFDDRERAALAMTEAVTKLGEHGVPDEVYDEARQHFSDGEIAQLVLAIGVINLWNRLSITFHAVPGSMDRLFGLDKVGLH